MNFFKKLVAWHNNSDTRKALAAQEKEEKELFTILLDSESKWLEINQMLTNGYDLDFIEFATLCYKICSCTRSAHPLKTNELESIKNIVFISINKLKNRYAANPFYFPDTQNLSQFIKNRIFEGQADGNLYLCARVIIRGEDYTTFSLSHKNYLTELYKQLLLRFASSTQIAKAKPILSPIITYFESMKNMTEQELSNKLNKMTQQMRTNNFAPITSANVQKLIESNASSSIEKKCVVLQNKILDIQHDYASQISGDDTVFLDRSLNIDIPKIISSYSATPKNISDKYLALSGTSIEQDLDKLLSDMALSLSALSEKYATSKALQIKKEIQIHSQYLDNKKPELESPDLSAVSASRYLSSGKK